MQWVKTHHEGGPKSGRRGQEENEGKSAVVSRIKWYKLRKIQLKCGVKTGFEVGHGA